MTYTVDRLIPTMAGSTVHLAHDSNGSAVILKRAQTPAAAADLAGYARQLQRLGEIPSAAPFYPPVLRLEDDLLVLPYYSHGSLDAQGAGDRAAFVRLVGQAVDAVFTISALHSMPAGVDAARAFWRSQLVSRFDRLKATGASVAEPPFSTISGWLASGYFDQLLDAAVTRPLGLAAHGDFGLNNVMLAAPGSELRFIDLRGATPWADDLPWWDPILDLATLITFHCRIEPALGVRDGIAVSGPHNRATLTPDEIVALCPPSWTDGDPGWRLRLQLGIVIRILGSVSVQLTSAPIDREARSGRVTHLLTQAIDELSRLTR
ncbi:hypothetical protein GCM10029976_087480 [Kribbella albertanoniae]|uniref:Aminoglycoside phosphotransferase domain-containing protein n=1 Tax=Kribbella albertanoniae TaxID=1266829 RepID=A0A4R4QI93_9ACTN|nr:phosphotransferase [Kribbella albertanoniae]TDC35290.1 hypothetical protein E1261_01805 [Kribbella albertanoniae]